MSQLANSDTPSEAPGPQDKAWNHLLHLKTQTMDLISQSLQALLECLSPNSAPPMAKELAPPAMAPALVPPHAYSLSTSPRSSCSHCLSPTPGDSHGCGHSPTTLHSPAVMLEMQEAWALCMALSSGPGGPLPFYSGVRGTSPATPSCKRCCQSSVTG
ncbi:hypothetical protein H2248_001942 [Termitomyces sp. 'cryptogamus']|nr:hypothetical protein H2248_001942 [Termitomyces sp. 'cryptogamus']